MSDNLLTAKKHYVLTSTDSEKLVGPAIIGWYCDYAVLAMKDGKFRPSTVTIRETSILKSLNVIKGLRDDRLLRLEEVKHRIERNQLHGVVKDEPLSACERKVKAIEKIYPVPFSGHRQKGWAIYFALSDLKTFCFDASGEALPRSRFRAWEWSEMEAAAQWMEGEVSKINERIAAKNRLLPPAQPEPASEVAERCENSENDTNLNKKRHHDDTSDDGHPRSRKRFARKNEHA